MLQHPSPPSQERQIAFNLEALIRMHSIELGNKNIDDKKKSKIILKDKISRKNIFKKSFDKNFRRSFSSKTSESCQKKFQEFLTNFKSG